MASAERENLPIDNVHLTGKETNQIWYPGPAGDEIVERYCREMSQAAEVDVRLGIVHVTWGFQTPPFNELGMNRLKQMVDHAEKVGFTIAFENSVSITHYRAALETFRSPNVCFCFDTGHWNEFCPEEDIYTRYGDLMRVTHIDDNDGKRDLHIIPFDGCADFSKLTGVLRRMDRLTFEVSGAKRVRCEAPREEIRRGLARLQIAGDDHLVHIYDNEFTLYEDLSYAEYLQRLMTAAMRLRDMVEA